MNDNFTAKYAATLSDLHNTFLAKKLFSHLIARAGRDIRFTSPTFLVVIEKSEPR